ncbi:MAG: acetolactate synthase large subunit [Pseudomonadota bacterium]
MSADATKQMTGAEALVGTLADAGVDACFANPGTSEMHLVTALDREPRIQSVLCLFEGVATGAADGYARAHGKPAMTLLHLGAGYLNAGANIHNARRAHTPMINVIGDHATYHTRYDAPLTSDITGMAGPNSVWIKSIDTPARAGDLAMEAFAATHAPLPGPASLVLPADTAWLDGGAKADPVSPRPLPAPSTQRVDKVANSIRSASKPVLVMNGASALSEAGLASAARLKAAGVRVMTDTFYPIMARGAGRFVPDRMQYFAEMAMKDLEGSDLMVLAGTQTPAAFFAYPEKPSLLVPEGCEVASLCDARGDGGAALAMLADALDAQQTAPPAQLALPDAPTGALDTAKVAAAIARHLPDGALVSDDGVSNSLPVYMATATARPHRWMMLTGGAIGQGMPLAIGAALRGTPTLCLSGDGAGMYTNQALWTMARENLPVVTVVFVNHTYRILQIEMHRTGAGNPGPSAQGMLTLGNPQIDWASLARAQGVTGHNAHTGEELEAALTVAFGDGGPHLIAVHIPG